MSQLFAWDGQSTGVSALASFLPKKSKGWSPLEWTGWISLQSKGLSRVFSNTTVQKHQFFGAQLSLWSNSHIHTQLLEKPVIALTGRTFVAKVMSLLLNILSRLVITFLPKSKRLLTSWLQSLSAVILEPKKKKTVSHCFHCFPIYLPWNDGTRCHDLSFLNAQLLLPYPLLLVCMLSCFSRVQLFATPWTKTHQAPLSLGFSRQVYWSEFPCPPPGNLPHPGVEPSSLISPAYPLNSKKNQTARIWIGC